MLIWLQLFYNKRSQFLSGTEAEKVAVSVGQKVRVLPPVMASSLLTKVITVNK